jgi:hypothetical protein
VAFDWIADADMRLGPVLEAILNGRYYWIPFSRTRRIEIEKPEDLRDLVWMPAHFEFANGGEAVGLIPTRYPGSETSEDGAICLARKTVWQEVSPGVFHGLGQRLLATDKGEYPHGRAQHSADRDGIHHRPDDGGGWWLRHLPSERLQPALLDRLTDDEPDKNRRADKRVLTKTQLRQAVLRDLAWLFNTTGWRRRRPREHAPGAEVDTELRSAATGRRNGRVA